MGYVLKIDTGSNLYFRYPRNDYAKALVILENNEVEYRLTDYKITLCKLSDVGGEY